MRRRSDTPLVRRNLALPKGFVDQLSALRTKTESSSDSEVIRRALTSYEQFAEDCDNHIALRVRRSNGEIIRLGMDYLKEPEPRELIHVNLILHEGSDQRLDALRALTRASSDSEVVRKALKLYDILVSEYYQDSTLELHHPDGNMEIVRYWGIPKRPRGGGPSSKPSKKRKLLVNTI
jgi:Arc/MetJ-type ribon-helix-helix transcriptional regulator